MRYLSLWDVFKFTCLIISIQDNVSAGVSYKKLGCYNDNGQENQPLPQLLFTDRDELSSVYSGKKYVKEDFDRPYLDDIVGRCAAKSEKLGYEVFGIEKFAECWSGDGAYETYKKDGPSRQCFTSKYEPCNYECEGEPCAGSDHTIFVYKLGKPSKTSTSCLSSTKTSPAPPATKPTKSTQPTSPASNRPSTRSVSRRPTRLPSKRRTAPTPRVKPPTNSAAKTAVTRPKPTIRTKPATKITSTASPSTVKSLSTPARLYSTKATLATPGTTPVPSKRPTKTTRCMEHIPIHLSCPPQCQTSCTAVCPPACCVGTPLYPPAVYSPPVYPLPVYQCPDLCSLACGPRCSFKCCKAAFYIKRKDILRKRKRHKLRRGQYNLLDLKKSSRKVNWR